MPLGRHLQACHHSPRQRYQVGRFPMESQPSCLQARHIEQILSEFIQACSGLIDLLEGFALPCSQFRPFATFRLIHEHLGKAFEHRQGIAQLMGSHSDELVFEVFSFLEGTHVLVDDQRH